jgi:hypothetical protein
MISKIIFTLTIVFVSFYWLAWTILSFAAFFNITASSDLTNGMNIDNTYLKVQLSAFMLLSFITSLLILYLNFKSLRLIIWSTPFVVKKLNLVWVLSLVGLSLQILNEFRHVYNYAQIRSLTHPLNIFALQLIIFGYILYRAKKNQGSLSLKGKHK